MNNSIKNVMSFIKEALELKNKNIYTIDDYEFHLDFGQFYSQFKDLDFIEKPDYSSFNITSNGTLFRINYISNDKKREIPDVPIQLVDYIFLKNGNDIISKIDNLEEELESKGLLSIYKSFDSNIKEINKYNSLIDLYNSKYMNFYNFYKRINDYEEKIEVIFGQKLLLWDDGKGNKIKRYILEANLEIIVDPINNIISLNFDNNKFKGFVTDFLNLDSYKVKDNSVLYDFIKKFNDDVINLENINIDDEVKKYVNFASLENSIINDELVNNQEIKTNKTYIFDNCGIIVRNKNVKLWIEDLEKIIDLCNNTEFISPILNMFEVNFDDEQQVLELLNDSSYMDTKDDDVLFPLPSNDEQYKIVDKVKQSNVVLVQGPPGTGKSHTIANLLSHYISEGKKVIVTSEKAKALDVLRNKIPEQIRSLSLSLLTSKGVDKDLEFSIETVLKNQKDDSDLEGIEEVINSLSSKLDLNHKKKQEVLRKIIDLMSKDTVSHKEELNEITEFSNTNELTLMDLAVWLEKNREYKFVPLTDIENYMYPDSKEFFDKLDDIANDIKNKQFAISSNIPINDYLNNNEIELSIKECLGYKNYKLQNSDLISSIKQSSLKNEIVDELGLKINSLNNLYQYFDKEWIKSNIEYPVFKNKIKELLTLLNENEKFILKTEEDLFDYSISTESNKEEYLNVTNDIIELFDNKGNIGLLNKLKFNSYIKLLNGLLYNNSIISKDNVYNDFIKINNALKYDLLIESIKTKINQLLNINLFDIFNISKNQFGKHIDKIKSILTGFDNYDDYAREIDKLFAKVINTNLFSINYLNSDEDKINSIYSDLKYYVTENNSINKTDVIINELRNYYSNYNLQNLNKLLVSIQTNQLDDYISCKNSLLYEINVINQYNNIKKMYSHLVNDKQEFIRNYIYKFSEEEKQFIKNNITKVFKYHYVEKFYLNLENNEKGLPELFNERNELVKEEKRIIADLISCKGWYYQNKHMTPGISLSLNKWITLKKKLGSGTGKNANLYLRQMREEMNTAKNAIPVWIMPVDKLIEQYPFNNNPPFDVLIMDESSQSSVFSISALSRAKKVIIVGDDKQISPTNAFTAIDGINDLRTKYLKGNSWDLQISRDTSIYDIVQTICGNKKVALTEHFRCLPEIINYSNKEFYNMEINPLKVRGKENTIEKPIKTIFVPNATCKKIGNQVYNQAEVDRIVMLLGEIANDSQYDNKTIGVIALQNSTRYIQKLTELIMQKFGEKFINERKIKIGSTYDFQGDERDVIILGMIISSILENGEKYNFRALTTQEFDKSFNVAASRAKEQMILVHSVKLEELNPSCNRYRLLNYCLNYDNEKEIEFEKLFESNFEKDIYYYLTSKGYKLVPQFKIGNYRLDFVLTNDNNQKIAIECDGDSYHGIKELEHDLERQSILERCGWKFARIRASEFYYNREESCQKLIDIIDNYLLSNDVVNYVIENDNNTNNNQKNIDENEINNSLKQDSQIEKNELHEKGQIHLSLTPDKIGPSQFKFMVLFSNGYSRKAIAEYYKVEYDTVKKALQIFAKKYNVSNAEECKSSFKNDYFKDKTYNTILEDFIKNNSNFLDEASSKNSNVLMQNNLGLSADDLGLVEQNSNQKNIDEKELSKIVNLAIKEHKKVKIMYYGTNKRYILNPLTFYEKNGKSYLKVIDISDNKVKLFSAEKIGDIELI